MGRQTQTDDATDEPTNDQAEYVAQIDSIVVKRERVIKHFEHNQRRPKAYDQRSLKVSGIRSDGPAQTTPKVDPRDDGAYFPDGPHPVFIRPKSLIEGASHDDERDLPRRPTLSESCQEFRHQSDDDLPEDHTDWTDEKRAALDEFHETALDWWRDQLQIKEELTFEFRAVAHNPERERTIEHTVEIVEVSGR